MNACIVYSSCTGNTRKVAEALADTSGLPCFPVRIAPEPVYQSHPPLHGGNAQNFTGWRQYGS